MKRATIERVLEVLSAPVRRPLTCDMSEDCRNPVTHIGSKGWVYCAECRVHRKGWERTRKIRPWEMKLLLAGEPLPAYYPIRKPKQEKQA